MVASSSLHHFGFGDPLRLLSLILVPIVLLFITRARRLRARYTVTFTNVGLLADVIASRRRRFPDWLGAGTLALALVASCAALARPHVQLSTANRTATIVLLVDVSDSMRALDIRPNRLTAVVTAMHEFVDELPNSDKVGLVTFSDKVDVLTPPTTDHAAVRTRLDILTPQGGTALGDAAESAIKLVVSTLAADGIRRSPGQYLPGAIVLESDGAQNRGKASPFQAAQLAQATGVRIYGVALGRPHAFVVQGSGYLALKIPVPPDPDAVGVLVNKSGGKAYAARNATQLEAVYRHLGQSIGTRPQLADITSWFEVAAAALLGLAVALARLRDGLLP